MSEKNILFFDVIVVGSGAAGAVVCEYLSRFNLEILCIERGGFQDPLSFPSVSKDWEIIKYPNYDAFPNSRQSSSDSIVDDSLSDISVSYFNAVGGSTTLFSGHFPRLHPSDFRVKSLYGIADDWPISYSELEPFYEEISRIAAVSGLEGDPAYPKINGLLPPIPWGKLGEKLARGFNELGWHWWPSYSAIASHDYRHQNRCINVGTCNLGCPQNAKSSADVTFWPIALSRKVKLLTNTVVTRLIVDSSKQIRGVKAKKLSGENVEFHAGNIVLACNGLETPRLLLNSACREFPRGIGNERDLVGRNLMFHPLAYIEGIFDEDLESSAGPQGCVITSQEFYETNESRDFKRGFTFQALRGPGLIECATQLAYRNENVWGSNHHETFQSKFNKTAHLAAITEDLPRLENRIMLHPNKSDRWGSPIARVIYKLDENSKKILSFAAKRGVEVMQAAGAVSTMSFAPVKKSGWHLMGTARMGTSPEDSVVDSRGRVFGCENLFIADGSTFVTSGAVNPSWTIQANALRIATELAKSLGLDSISDSKNN